MVSVFVREQNGGEIFRRAANTGKAQADLARRKAGVHEDARLGGLDVGAIAGGTAAEDGKFDGHDRKLVLRRRLGKFFPTVSLTMA